MTTFWLLLLALGSLAISGFLAWAVAKTLRQISADNATVRLRELELLSKMTGILSAKDPLTYQAIQVMDTHPDPAPFDPSDAAEARREAELHGEDLSDEDDDLRALADAFE